MKIPTALRLACLVTVGALALPTADAAEYQISNTGLNGLYADDYGGVPDLGQTFTATATGRVTRIELAVGWGEAALTLQAYTGIGPGGTLLYTKVVDLSSVSTVIAPGDYTFHAIAVDFPVTAGGVYRFVLSPGASFNIGYANYVTSTYPNGALYSARFGTGGADPIDINYDLTFRVTISDAASIGGAVGGQTIDDTATLAPFANLTVSDPFGNVTATVALDTAAKGVFTADSLAASGFVSGGSGTYTRLDAIAPAAMQAAIRQLVFAPTANRIAAGSTETTTFTVTVSDEIVTPATNSTTTVVTTPVNDAPVLDIAGAPTLAGIAEDPGVPVNGATASSTLVSSLVDLAGTSADGTINNVTDPDAGAVTGIAVTGVSQGTLYFTTNGGTSWTAAAGVSAGTALLLAADGNTRIAFVPSADFYGTITNAITFKAWDCTAGTNGSTGVNTGTGTAFSSATDTAAITITQVNDMPTANPDSVTVLEDSGSTMISVLANDSSAPDVGETLTVISVVQPAGGTVNFTANSVNFTPSPNFNGSTTFSYTIDDGNGGTATATVTVNVTAVDDFPTAVADTLTVAEDSGPTVVNVLANDSIAPDVGETLAVNGVTQPATGGTVNLTGGVVRFTPASNFNGTTSFSYSIIDSHSSTAIATVTVTVNAMNDNPVANIDTFSVAEDSGPTVFDVLANDTCAPDAAESLTIKTITQPTNGTVSFTDSNLSFTPAANFNGSTSFTYGIDDGHGGTSTATVSVSVTGVNDAPAFVGGVTTLTVGENSGAASITGLLHASDPDIGQTLNWSQSAAPAHGTLAFASATAATGSADVTSGGTITYTPTPNYAGSDSFTVQVSDGTATATRTINVTINVAATELRFTTQPSGSVSGVAFTGQPVVTATDSSGRVDSTFVGDVTLTVGSGAGSLSGTLVKQAVAGVATFTDVAYTATADQQAFALTTSNTAGLANATSSSITSDVVATKLRFVTQPVPLAMASTVTRTFTTPPVVQAVDANSILDAAYAANVVLSLTASDGTATPGAVASVAGTGDTDAMPTSVTIAATGGVVTFAGLSVNYMNSGNPDALALHATSGLLTAANSSAISSRIDVAPNVNVSPTGGGFTEGGPAVVVASLVNASDSDDSTLAWATVAITQNFTAGQDVLSFVNNGTNMGNITAAYDAGTGILTLTSAGATATWGEWSFALEAVKYSNASDSPNTATRTISYTVNDGFLSSSGASPFARATVPVIAVNDAPTLSGGPVALTATDEDTLSAAASVTSLLAGLAYADSDGSVPSGIAITQTTGSSSWGYSTDGVTWAAMGTVSSTSALLLTSTSRIRYVPNGTDGETASITFRGWDQTSGIASTNSTRGLANASVNGGTTAFSTGTAQATLAVTPVNDPPALLATAQNPSFVENGAPSDLFSDISISPVEAGQTFTEIQFTITNVAEAAAESVIADGTTIALADGVSGTTATNALSYAVTVAGSTATVTLGKAAGLTSFAAWVLIDTLSYSNSSDNPGNASRVVTLTRLQDSGGTVNGGVDTTALSIASTVSVTPVNDAPVIGGAVAAQAVSDTATISPFATLTISDPDSNVSATVAPDAAAKGAFTLGSLASSGFATADGGATYTHAATTPGAMQIAIGRLVFVPTANRVGAGLTETTTLVVTISDGLAAPVANHTTTVISSSLNDAPMVTSGGAVTVQENQTSACTVTGADADPGAVLSYAISGGADAARFAIDAATGVVTFKFAPDYESPDDAGGDHAYDITVTVSDGSLTSAPRVVAIRLISVNEAPTDLALSGTTLGQAAGTNAVVGTLSTTDPDAGDLFTYTLVAGTGSTDNASFNVSGASLRANNPAALATGSHSVRVRSTDIGGLWFEKAFVVTVTDNLGPMVSAVTGPPAGTYRCGDLLEFTVTFNDSVTVTGTPKLDLTIGGVARTAAYFSLTGGTDLLFRYVVVQGDHAASGEVVVGALDVTGATIRDAAGNDATLTFTAPTLAGVLVDALTHSADTNVDWKISLIELTRVIELYNTRSGSSRTGDYHAETGTEDGFAPGAGALTSWHSADCNHDGSISLLELTRVIELYNTRTGSSRTGDYHAAGGTEDGFAPGTH